MVTSTDQTSDTAVLGEKEKEQLCLNSIVEAIFRADAKPFDTEK